jgi:hypothetical protein
LRPDGNLRADSFPAVALSFTPRSARSSSGADSGQNLSTEMNGEQKETLLRGLAYSMMQHRVPVLGWQGVLNDINPLLHRL